VIRSLWLAGCASLLLGSWVPPALADKPAGVLSVNPTNGLVSVGFLGGPFNPSSQIYALTNSGNASLSWATTKSRSWVSLSATNGTLLVGASTSVTVLIKLHCQQPCRWQATRTPSRSQTSRAGKGTTNRAVGLVVNPIPAPSALTATVISATQINLSWADNSNAQYGFKIDRSADGTNFTQIAQVLPDTTTYRDTGAWPGTIYYYRVHAYNTAGNSAFSKIASARALDLRPTAIIDLGLTAPAGLTWVVAVAAGALSQPGIEERWYHRRVGRQYVHTGYADGWTDRRCGRRRRARSQPGVEERWHRHWLGLQLLWPGNATGWLEQCRGNRCGGLSQSRPQE